MKRLLTLLLLLAITTGATAQSMRKPRTPRSATKQTTELRKPESTSLSEFHFRNDGTFRIMQLTDVHFTDNQSQSGHVPKMLTQLIEREKPDVIILTGDLIYSEPGDKTLRRICGVIEKTGVPYAFTQGNHDAEQGLSRSALYEVAQTLPGCINASFNTSDQRQGTFTVPVLTADGAYGAMLYIMDSNDYNADDHSYAGVDAEQVAWYQLQSKAFEEQIGHKINSLMFMHIPLPEYSEAYNNDPHRVGFRLEQECPGRDNHGMFAALVARGDVAGVFAGHDHSNDYIAVKEGIALGYGRYSGGFGEYQDLLSGARMVELRQDKPGFVTWIRLANGREIRKTTYPAHRE